MPATKKKNGIFRLPTDELRIYVAAALTLLIAGVIVLRLLYIQLWEKHKYARMADQQYVIEIPVEAQRGVIYDRNMEYLALNEPCISIGLDKLQMTATSREYARILAPVLGSSAEDLRRRISTVKGNFLWLRRRLDVEIGPKIAALNLPGIRIEKDSRRIYPHHEVASHILGFTDPDNIGIEGIELYYNEVLRGKNGLVVIQRDGRGRAVPENIVRQVSPQDGKALVLTVDYIIQSIATEELRHALREYNARYGMVVICDPRNGEILAIANEPGYNPNHPARYAARLRRNKAVTDVFEPGSTFKIVTFSALLEAGNKQINDLVFCENGLYRHNGRLIRDVKNYGWLTVGGVLQHSSNIGTAKLAEELGPQAFYAMVEKLGFGRRTGIDLPGETAGLVKPPSAWSDFTLASMAFGQEISVSALQLVMAYAAIANGGVLHTPRVLKGVVEPDGRFRELEYNTKGRRVLSPETAHRLTELLIRVVEEGTGTPARIEGMTLAGKTGTAQKALPNRRGYSDKEFIANFAGFFPADAPRYLVYVLMETGMQNQWGRFAAATFKNIAERIRVQEKRLLTQHPERVPPGAEPELARELSAVVMPDLINRKATFGIEMLRSLGLEVEKRGRGAFIRAQSPAPGTRMQEGQKAVLDLFAIEPSDGLLQMPVVVGLSLREALNVLAIHNLEPVVYGTGQVRRQNPAPGTPVRAGARCVVECEPQAMRAPETPTKNLAWKR